MSSDRQTAPDAAPLDDRRLLERARNVLTIEADAVRDLLPRLDQSFTRACRLCIDCEGRIVVTGMGKSGHIGGKIAATLASTGTPAFFMHPGEASHGDAGMITRIDLLLAVSYSGETGELITILPLLKRLGVPMLTITGNPTSTLGAAADVNLNVCVAEEACPLNLAPTASTTATLAIGDALAVALLEARGFTAEDFARSHPGGSLGRRLLLRVQDVMHTGAEIPRVGPDTLLGEALVEMTRKGLGMTAIVHADETVLGILTDGDLRRALDGRVDVHATRVSSVMTANPKTVGDSVLAAEAVHTMEEYKITALLVVDEHSRLCGALNIHDLLRAGVM